MNIPQEISTRQLIELHQKISHLINARLSIDPISKLNTWSNEDMRRSVKYDIWLVADKYHPDRKMLRGTLNVIDEEYQEYTVSQTLPTKDNDGNSLKRQLQESLAVQVLFKLNIN